MNSKNINLTIFIALLLLSLTGFSQNSDQKMQNILKEKRTYNTSHNNKMGYRIQIYNGTSETRAQSILGNFSGSFPNVGIRLFFEQPEWKVQVGNYLTKLEAHRDLQKIREEFGSAFLLKAKIRI